MIYASDSSVPCLITLPVRPAHLFSFVLQAVCSVTDLIGGNGDDFRVFALHFLYGLIIQLYFNVTSML